MLPLVIVALLAASASAQAFNPNCFFNVSMSDNSPLVQYKPNTAWQSIFVNSPRNSWQAGAMGQGASSHSTFGLGPFIEIEYPGSIAWAKGGIFNGSETPVRMDIDNIQQPYPVVNDSVYLLTSNKDLQTGAHSVKISLDQSSTNPEALLIFLLFQSMCGVVAETNDSEQVNCHTVEFAKEIANRQVILKGGNWKPYQQFGGVGGQPFIDYTSIVANNTPSVQLFPPKGSNYFYLNGTVGNVYGQYTVDIQPSPPYPRQVNTFNASNSWDVPGELLYYTPLDPNVEYTVTVTGDQDITKYLGLNSWMYCDYQLGGNGNSSPNNTTGASSTPTPTPTPGKKTNVGAIAGGVVGGVVAAAAIAALLFFLCRRNRKKGPLDVDHGVFTVDDTVDATTPYQPPPVGSAKLAAGEESYSGHPHYGQTMYQEPNMAEVGYGAGAGAAPLLSPFGSDGRDSRHNSMQSGGPFGDSRQGSAPWPGSDASYPLGSDGRQSFNGGSITGATAGMGMAGYASGQGSAHGASSHSGYTSGYQVNEKSVPAHQRTFRVEHEQDAGGLPIPAEDVERLPPTYDPHWLETQKPQPESFSSIPAGAAPAHKPDVVADESQIPAAAAAAGSSQPGVVYPVEKS
ncbi:hypothetical protein CspHIS471_0503070 [Cutaneotrichosporon sp. HIS471]|nr:hypothetical protein CspHIS471_0503070 [Cutaneotrichosporon sp. HIS471]